MKGRRGGVVWGWGEVHRYKGTSFKTERPKVLSIGGKVRKEFKWSILFNSSQSEATVA